MCGWQPTATICPDSSVGRAADSYPAGQWFDPTSWHHLLSFHFLSNRPGHVYQNCSLYRAGSAKVACRSHKPKTRFESYARVQVATKYAVSHQRLKTKGHSGLIHGFTLSTTTHSNNQRFIIPGYWI